jgi:YHS domain-containing protein
MRMSIIAMILLLAAAAPACRSVRVQAGQTQPGISPIATNKAENYIPGQGEYNTAAECPVCRSKFSVRGTTPAVKCAGETYYFCCPTCREEFKENPPPAPGK